MREDLIRVLRSLLLAGLSVSASMAYGAEVAQPNHHRFVRLRLTVENPASAAMNDARLWLYMPVTSTGSQTLERLSIEEPHHVTTDNVGNSVVEIELGTMPPFGTRILQISAEAVMSSEPRRADIATVKRYLIPERYIESDEPQIRTLAQTLHRPTERDTVEAIYAWVRANIHYDRFNAADLGARQALKSRVGDCTEYAYVVAALARANGLPARVLGGYVSDHDFAPRSADYHNWAEVYIDGHWQLVDAQKGNLFQGGGTYVAFRIVSSTSDNALGDYHRFRATEGLNVRFGL